MTGTNNRDPEQQANAAAGRTGPGESNEMAAQAAAHVQTGPAKHGGPAEGRGTNPDAAQHAGQPAAPVRKRGNRRAGSPGPAGLLPGKAKEDDPRVWGDGPEDRDSWLLEQRPPHWG